MFNSNELQRELDELEMASYLTRILPEFARGNAKVRKSRYESELERRATWLRKVPLDHPRRAEVEAERTTIEAELAELHAHPIDCAGILIDAAVYRHTDQDLSTAEEPAEADRTGQSTERTDDQLADGSQSEKNLALVSVPGAASIPASVPEPASGENEGSGIGSDSLSREERLQAFIVAHPGTTLADIKYSARVHTPELQDWRKDRLKQQSVMSQRIEDVLSGATQLKKKPPKARTD